MLEEVQCVALSNRVKLLRGRSGLKVFQNNSMQNCDP